jgi:hypothetical protein
MDSFIVPGDEEFLYAFGVELASADVDGDVRAVRIPVGEGEVLEFSYDLPGRSVRIRALRGGSAIADLFYEGVSKIMIRSGRASTGIEVDLADDSYRQSIIIQVYPVLGITGRRLLS